MGKHDPFSPKAVANKIKAKGLQRLRWYCQMCQKQCRDQNGFKCHCASESHQRQMAIFAENPERYMEQFSQEFEEIFMYALSRRYGTKKVHANQVYQEIIADRQHLHMNATKWDTLTDFVVYLGRNGKCKVEETERGWFVEWIDNSPEALARKEAILKKERHEMNDEQLEQKLLKEQIARARKHSAKSQHEQPEATDLKREGTDQPIKISWKQPNLSDPSSGHKQKIGLKFKSSVSKSNPLKGPKKSVFSALKSSSSSENTTSNASTRPPKKLSAMEEIITQEQKSKKAARLFQARSDPSVRRTRSRSPERDSQRGSFRS